MVDEQAAQDFDNATDLVCIDQLHAAIDKAMDLTCGDRQREVIEQRYYEERSLKQCGDSMGISYSRVRQIECEALRRMRQPRARRLLQPFSDELLGTAAYSYSTTMGAWKNKGSNPERVVEYMEQLHKAIV